MLFPFCLFLSYLAAVAQMMGFGNGPLFLPAVVLVLVVRGFPAGMAAAWGFALGLLLDALGDGPLGLQALVYVALALWLASWGNEPAAHTAWRWFWVTFTAACCGQFLPAAWELVPAQDWDRWEPLFVAQFASSALTAVLLGGIVAAWRQLTGTPCATR
jgi:rod shape-determining protein MreD